MLLCYENTIKKIFNLIENDKDYTNSFDQNKTFYKNVYDRCRTEITQKYKFVKNCDEYYSFDYRKNVFKYFNCDEHLINNHNQELKEFLSTFNGEVVVLDRQNYEVIMALANSEYTQYNLFEDNIHNESKFATKIIMRMLEPDYVNNHVDDIDYKIFFKDKNDAFKYKLSGFDVDFDD